MHLSVLLVVHDLSSGAVARAWALSEVLELLGHRTRTTSVVGEGLWAPARGTAFGRTCSRVDPAGLSAAVADGTDLVVAVKALPASFGLARRLAREHGVPLLLDVDDPDIEGRTVWLPPRAVSYRLRHHPLLFAQLLALRRAARRIPTTVSNPVLQQLYGGEVVPHARTDRGPGAPHTSERPTLAFIGTARPHKGMDLLRGAVEQLAPEGWRLLVTAVAPHDARPWESWVGEHVPDSRALLATTDVVAMTSQPATGNAEDFGRAQLPLKLVDAMLAGRAAVVSDYGPLGWAAGPAAPVFRHGDVDSLVAALRPLRDPARRQRLGDALRAEALARYTPDAVAPALQRALAGVLGPLAAGSATSAATAVARHAADAAAAAAASTVRTRAAG